MSHNRKTAKHWPPVLIRLAVFLCFSIGTRILVSGEHRRPLYIIANMVNSLSSLDEYISRGANAIEANVRFYDNGTVSDIHYGYPCDCHRACNERENFAIYLNQVRDMVNPIHPNYQQSLTLLFLSLKMTDVPDSHVYRAGEEVANYLISHLWNEDLSNPRIGVLISIGNTYDRETVTGVRDTFTKSNREDAMKRLGFDVGLGGKLDEIRKMWISLGVHGNLWQGDGSTNCFRMNLYDTRLRQAVRIRDADDGYIDKVYDFNVDITATMRSSLRLGVDAIITNFPERLLSVLQEEEFTDKYRIANSDDNPFSKFRVQHLKSK